jgi:uncharacterized protein involved in exopolysaccharide biosynthesis/Mrp family chromosome partitioning ATPase
MARPPITTDAPAFTPGDAYYILFRHKWKIIICAVAGLIAAVGFYFVSPPHFQSEAKLFIRYVVTDTKMFGQDGTDATAKTPDQRGETIMDSEVQILTSLDLARGVAETVGADKILAKSGGGKDVGRAAEVIERNLYVDVPSSSSVIRVSFTHPDPDVVQPVVRELIYRYLKMHVEAHRTTGLIGDYLNQETDQLRLLLNETEDELRKALNKAGVISLADAKQVDIREIAQISESIREAQADLVERSTTLQEVAKNMAQAPAPPVKPASAPAQATSPEISPKIVDEYRAAVEKIDILNDRLKGLLLQYTEENSLVKDYRNQLEQAESAKTKLQSDYPGLLRNAGLPSASSAQATSSNASGPDGIKEMESEKAKLLGLQARIKALNDQLTTVQAHASKLTEMEGTILELERRRDREMENYRYYATRLEQARTNEALGTAKVSNISQIEAPSAPFIDWTTYKKRLMTIAASGLGVGLAWAVLIEMYLDRSVRRPIDFERSLSIPLFLSIPELGGKGKRRLRLPGWQKLKALTTRSDKGAKPDTELVSWDTGHPLRPFHETLRDRLIGYFESRNLTHKPKMLAVTGLGSGAGVTTTAAGLASCLSETGDGNVLLVDLTPGQGSARQFYRGEAITRLDDLFTVRDSAQVQDKLYVVAGSSETDTLSRILPQRFNKLVPQLKTSNFDYIIFDMPPVSQISITPRLAGFMDMVLIVIESEKTDRHLVQKAAALLASSNAHVGAVLNKSRQYVPRRLHEESLGNG